MADRVVVPSVEDMDDETLIKHLELRHADDLKLEFGCEPDRLSERYGVAGGKARRLLAGSAWRAYHDAIHRLYPEKYDHEHRSSSNG